MRIWTVLRLALLSVVLSMLPRPPGGIHVASMANAQSGSAQAPASADLATCRGRDVLPELVRQDRAAEKKINAEAEATSNSRAVLWRVAREGLADSYLFGTIHMSDARVLALPAAVTAALDGAKHLAVEVADLSPEALAQAIGGMREKVVFLDGRSLDTLLKPEESARAKLAAEKAGLPEDLLRVARPWIVTMLLAISDCERARMRAGGLPLDMHLIAKARATSIPVTGLETIGDQLSAMAAVPEGDQLTVLRASLAINASSNDAVETILQRYLNREIGKVWPMQEAMWRQAGFDPAAFESFRRELITVRNGHMRDAALPLLAKGGIFVAVGALHLVGQDGLVALFREAGYTVTAIN